jgi:hypothetical protein
VDIHRIKHAVGVTPKALLRLVAIARSLSSAFWTRELSFRAHSHIDVNSLKIKGQVRRAKLGWTSRMKGVCTVKKSAYS